MIAKEDISKNAPPFCYGFPQECSDCEITKYYPKAKEKLTKLLLNSKIKNF